MSASSWYYLGQPFPIPLHWGDSRNFEWRPVPQNYWCKLCRKYVDEKHINSRTHMYRKEHPNTYLWYLNEHRQPCQETMLTMPPPPLGPPPDYWHENDSTRTQRPDRGYEVGVPAPPPGPPPALTAAYSSSLGRQLELMVSPYPDDTHTTRDTVQNETKGDVSADPGSMVPNRWHRYAVDATRAAYWWWNPMHENICFLEDAPGEWRKYCDAASGQTYWYHEISKIWFWHNTGSTMCPETCEAS